MSDFVHSSKIKGKKRSAPTLHSTPLFFFFSDVLASSISRHSPTCYLFINHDSSPLAFLLFSDVEHLIRNKTRHLHKYNAQVCETSDMQKPLPSIIDGQSRNRSFRLVTIVHWSSEAATCFERLGSARCFGNGVCLCVCSPFSIFDRGGYIILSKPTLHPHRREVPQFFSRKCCQVEPVKDVSGQSYRILIDFDLAWLTSRDTHWANGKRLKGGGGPVSWKINGGRQSINIVIPTYI